MEYSNPKNTFEEYVNNYVDRLRRGGFMIHSSNDRLRLKKIYDGINKRDQTKFADDFLTIYKNIKELVDDIEDDF